MEVGLEDLGLDFFDVVEVGTVVEFGELLLEETAVGDPSGCSDWGGHQERFGRLSLYSGSEKNIVAV